MRLLVTGGRDFADRDLVYRVLDDLRPDAVIHGGAGKRCIVNGEAMTYGADLIAAQWAQERGVCEIRVNANWTQHGRAAGPLRNGWMIEHCRPDLVVAFRGGKGTADMVRQAKAAGIEVREQPAGDDS